MKTSILAVLAVAGLMTGAAMADVSDGGATVAQQPTYTPPTYTQPQQRVVKSVNHEGENFMRLLLGLPPVGVPYMHCAHSNCWMVYPNR